MKRFTLALLALLFCCACVGARAADYVEVSFGELIAQPWRYDGQRVRVRGYLVSLIGGAQIGDPAVERCYGNDAEHRFIMTSLPQSALGEWDGAYPEFEGRLVTVVGVFRNSPTPWRPHPFALDPEERVVGPIHHARIEAMSHERCVRIGEGSGS